MIGRELGLPEQRIARLRLAGLLHDIGKVGIADSILDKPGPLSPSEWDQVRRHPEMAARILAARELTDIREWVLAPPRAARRSRLPARHQRRRHPARVADPRGRRVLRRDDERAALPVRQDFATEAIAEMGRYSGSQFDGAVVDALVRALDRAAAGAAV